MSFLDHFKAAQKKNDFSIEIQDADWDSKWASLVSKQTAAVDVNLVKRRIVFYLRQLKSGVIQDVIFHVLNKPTKKIDHILVRPAKTPEAYEYHFKGGEVVDHKCDFDYGNTKDLIHVLTVDFAEVELKTPARDQRTSVVLKDEKPKKQILMEDNGCCGGKCDS